MDAGSRVCRSLPDRATAVSPWLTWTDGRADGQCAQCDRWPIRIHPELLSPRFAGAARVVSIRDADHAHLARPVRQGQNERGAVAVLADAEGSGGTLRSAERS